MDRSGAVADELWRRVRELAARVRALEEIDAVDGLDEDGRARLVALRLRAERATRRAGLADELADRLAGLRPSGPGGPEGPGG